ncbi:MAG: radical SAM protein [bacterium]|nr:radical SAM protein [bacterium]
MKILILNPPTRDRTVMVKEGRCMQREGAWGYVMSPVTMVTMATLLKKNGHSVKVIDAGVDINDFSELLSRVKEFGPAVILINTSTPTIEDDLFTVQYLKKNTGNETLFVLFGIHVSVLYRDILEHHPDADICIIGEPEITVRDLVSALEKKTDLSSIDGLVFRDRDRNIIRTKERAFLQNLDELPIPDWSFVNTGNYRLPFSNDKFLLINTNRGCPFRCIFCNAYVYYGRVPRRRSVEHIIKELKNDVETFQVRNFMFWTEEFVLDRNFVKALAQAIIDEKLGIKWVCNSRVDAVDLEVLVKIKQAGCWNIAYGIESGSQEILDKIKKQTTLEQIKKAVNLARQAGLKTTGHVIIGFPFDDKKSMRKTEKFVNSLHLDFVQYYCAMPYPGTELYDQAGKNNWINTRDWKKWEHNYSVLDYPHLKSGTIMKTRKRFIMNFYFRPENAVRILIDNIRSPGHLLTFFKNVKEFLKWM